MTAIEQPTASRRRAKRGNYAPSRARREQIASAVLQIVDQSGFGDVTVVRISEQTGIPQSSVLYHFPTKDHLLVGAMEYADTLDREQPGLEGTWPELGEETLGRAIGMRLSKRNRLLLMTYLRGLATQQDNPANAYLARKDEQTIDHWTRLCSRMQEQGTMHKALDARRTAIQILALWQGLVQAYLRDDSLEPQTLRSLFIDGMRHLICQNWQEFLTYVCDPKLGI
ncbi:TetR family transcriptional regulator [Bifidobacterium thermophilum]